MKLYITDGDKDILLPKQYQEASTKQELQNIIKKDTFFIENKYYHIKDVFAKGKNNTAKVAAAGAAIGAIGWIPGAIAGTLVGGVIGLLSSTTKEAKNFNESTIQDKEPLPTIYSSKNKQNNSMGPATTMTEEIGFEIDFIPVGTGEKSGDAIAIRYGRLNSPNNFSQKVIVIDGGTLESGQKLVEHIKNVYRTTQVDLVINTHTDNDHCSGLREVLNNLNVKELWIHMPWHSSKDYLDLFDDGRITNNSLKERLKEALSIPHELETIARQKKIKIQEPFTGLTFDGGVIEILGPSQDYYTELLPNFRSTPTPTEEVAISKAFTTIKESVNWVLESMNIETLGEDGETSSENNSGTICLFNIAGKKFLLTADTGIPALSRAIAYAKNRGITLHDLFTLQVPHHGSRRNVSPSILNQIKGEYALISCAQEGEPKHPAKKVTNALIRRGAKVYANKGSNLKHGHNAPQRSNYNIATPIQFYNQVEE